MVDFKSVTLADRDLLVASIFPTGCRDSELAFGKLYCWQFQNCSSFAFIDHQLVIRFCFTDDLTVYALPGGAAGAREVVRYLASQAKEENLPLYLYGDISDLQDQLESLFPEVFEYRDERNRTDYLYLRDKWVNLRGDHYQEKRKYIHKFRETYDFRYTPMTAEMARDCRDIYNSWCERRHCEEENGLTDERAGIRCALEHYRELHLTGGVLWSDGKIVAFSFGEAVNADTFCVYLQWALTECKGAYQTIIREFARHIPVSYLYLNLGGDFGKMDIREDRQSWHPDQMLKKSLAVCAEGLWDKLL